MEVGVVKTVWYCLKVYNGPKVFYIAQEYAEHNLSWMDPSLVCRDEKECREKCNKLNSVV